MKITGSITDALILLAAFLISPLAHAGQPLWTFTPITATTLSMASNSVATVEYVITNQSTKSHLLMMTPITGVTQVTSGAGTCANPFTLAAQGSSCTLSLHIYGGQLTESIVDGPIVCEQGSDRQCYKPSLANVLHVRVGGEEFTVGGTITNLVGTVVLQNNSTDNATINNHGFFTFATALGNESPYEVTVLSQPAGQTCSVTNGSGRVHGANITNVIVNCVSNETMLVSSVTALGLSVNDPGFNPALTGTPRLITITNRGSSPAMNVTYSLSSPLPSGSTVSPESCGTIAASGTCVLTVTPGNVPSASPGDLNPVPIHLNISGTNTNVLTPTLAIVTYGSIYQGGYVYAINDATPDTTSISGAVLAQSDQASQFPEGIVWSSNGAGGASGNASFDIIPGVSELSTADASIPSYASAQASFQGTYSNAGVYPFPPTNAFLACNGRTEGACNSANILAFYNTYATHYGMGNGVYTLSREPTSIAYYAAGRCTGTISGYSDWYLPAICEMGPQSNGSGCNASTQNVVNQLPGLVGEPNTWNPDTSCPYRANCLAGYYWSSTEGSGFARNFVWSQYFATEGSSQNLTNKYFQLSVRCARVLTP